jgi:predicted HicB family RNase H-like nuclease
MAPRVPKRTRQMTKGPDVSHYSVVVAWSDEDDEYVASSPEWPGLSWLAGDERAAIAGLRKVMQEALAALEEDGEPPPTPRDPSPRFEYSGNIRLRMPKSLHEAMATRADQEGVSLNTLALTYISRGVGE